MGDRSLASMSSGDRPAGGAASPARALVLATISFALAFAAWGLVGGLASVFTRLYGLTASETAFLVAVPVLLGSLARLPMGMLTDRFGGRLVFTALLAFSSLAAFVVPLTASYCSLLVSAFLIGMAGSSFAVGAAFVSRWTPAARQGTALGVYGLGTMGQSLAVFVGPVVAARFGWETVFRGTGALLLVWAVAYFLLARNPPQAGRPATVAAMAAVLRRAPTAWLLGAFYFLTFGGFVAFSIYLPTLLRAQFGLAPADAGLRAAGFVVLATLMRPARRMAGGPDRRRPGPVVGLRRRRPVLVAPDMAVDGALHGRRARMRDADGTRQRRRLQARAGALPQRHRHGDRPRRRSRGTRRVLPAPASRRLPRSTGRDLARVPPVVRDRAASSRGQPARVPPQRRRVDAVAAGAARQALERVRAGAWATLVMATLAAAIVVGSRNLQHFDAALVGYTFATLFAAFGISYRYAMWLRRPPTRMYWRRGWQAFFTRRALAGNTVSLGRRALLEFAANAYIFRRGRLRGLAHWLIMWGCLLAAAITFPLVWGWIHFETVPGDLHMYRTFVFGIRCRTSPWSPPSPSSSSTGSSGRRFWSLPA